jgi:transposase
VCGSGRAAARSLWAPRPLIEICESSLLRELLARSSVVAQELDSLGRAAVGKVWIGIDAGTQHHHAAAVDDRGQVLWSMRVANDQAQIGELLDRAATDDQVSWAVDLIGCETALLRAMLTVAGQSVIYIPGRTVKVMSAGFAGEAKTDARDVLVIANTARMRRDLIPVKPPADVFARLSLLVSHRTDLVEDWVRGVNRLRRLMLGISPALARALNYTNVATLVLVSAYQSPQQMRDAGRDELIAHLRRHRALNVAKVADAALSAADQQHIALPAQDTAAMLAGQLATYLLQLHARIRDIDKAITAAFDTHPQADIIRSLPGIGTLVGAEFAVAVGDLSAFASPDHLAAYSGLAPVPRDSGRRAGNYHRPQRYNRRLRNAFYMAALTSINADGPSRTYYQRKRAEGRKHQQALIALARRRVNVLWALLRDNRPYQATHQPAVCEQAG